MPRVSDEDRAFAIFMGVHTKKDTPWGVKYSAYVNFITTGPKPKRIHGLTRPIRAFIIRKRAKQRRTRQLKLHCAYPPAAVFARSEQRMYVPRAHTYTKDGVMMVGMNHGTCVHAQCETGLRAILDVAYSQKGGAPDASMDIARILHEAVSEPDPCVPDFLAFLADSNLVPIASELPVMSPTLKLATSVDVVVYDRETHEFVMIELKSGIPPTMSTSKTHYIDAGHGLRVACNRGDSFIAHRIQLSITARMFREVIHAPVRAQLVYVTPVVCSRDELTTLAAQCAGHETRITVCAEDPAFRAWARKIKSLLCLARTHSRATPTRCRSSSPHSHRQMSPA